MKASDNIRYVHRQEIDPARWDQCIAGAPNGMIYAYVSYLDKMAKRWDALVLNDYEAIMPLTWNRKWGIRYLYQPPLTQQLGIFSNTGLSVGMIDAFLQETRKHFRFAEIFLNHDNFHPDLRPRNNYILSLNTSYNTIRSLYKNSLLKSLKKNARFQLTYARDFDPGEAIRLHRDEYGKRTPHVKQRDYDRFEAYCRLAQKEGGTILRAVFEDQASLLAVALFLKKKDRIYLLKSNTFPKGRQMGANHFLMDNFIKEFAGKELTLDFVGSDIPGIAFFYDNFGGLNQPYFFYRFNSLPWPLRLLK